MKSWRPNWSDTESPEPECQSHSDDDDEDIEQSPKRRRMSPSGLTCEIQGVEINQPKNLPDKSTNLALKVAVAEDNKPVAREDALKSSVTKGTRISGVFSINDSLNESLMDGSFSEQDIRQTLGDTEGHEGHNEDISSHPGSCYESCGENSIQLANHGKLVTTPPSVFYSCSSEASAVPTSVNSLRGPHASSTREIHACSTRDAQESPEHSHVTSSSSSFVTPARSSRGLHAGQSTSEQHEKKVFQTPVGNAPKHFQTASVTRIRFQSPMEITYDGPPRSCNTTPRRRVNHVSTMPGPVN